MNEIEAIRHVRHSGKFEPVMSSLVCAIGDVERLSDLTPDQMERLWAATGRLSKAALAKGKSGD